MLVGAVWLRDVGYAPYLAAATRFHPLDGARYLRAIGIPMRLVDLVAHHSYALLEARLRGCVSEMTAFDDDRIFRRAATRMELFADPRWFVA